MLKWCTIISHKNRSVRTENIENDNITDSYPCLLDLVCPRNDLKFVVIDKDTFLTFSIFSDRGITEIIKAKILNVKITLQLLWKIKVCKYYKTEC